MTTLEQLDDLLGQAGTRQLDSAECLTLVELLSAIPGRARAVVEALAHQRDAAAVEALLRLPTDTRGVVEGLFAALRGGVVRERVDGQPGARMLAIEFRSSSSRRFPSVLERAQRAFADELERLRIDDVIHYRVAIFEHRPTHPSLGRRVRGKAIDLEALHRDLLRVRGVRVWLNGWRLDDASPLRPPVRVHLLRAWLDWATQASSTREHE